MALIHQTPGSRDLNFRNYTAMIREIYRLEISLGISEKVPPRFHPCCRPLASISNKNEEETKAKPDPNPNANNYWLLALKSNTQGKLHAKPSSP